MLVLIVCVHCGCQSIGGNKNDLSPIQIARLISLDKHSPNLIVRQTERWSEIKKFYNSDMAQKISNNYDQVVSIIEGGAKTESQQEALYLIKGPLYLATYPVSDDVRFNQIQEGERSEVTALDTLKDKQGRSIGERNLTFSFRLVDENWVVEDICITFAFTDNTPSMRCVRSFNEFLYGKLNE